MYTHTHIYTYMYICIYIYKMTTHSSVLAEPGGLPSMGSHRVGHDWSDLAAAAAYICLVAQLCPTLWDPMDCSPPASSVHGILQARVLEWASMPSSRGSSQPRNHIRVSCITGGLFTCGATRETGTYVHIAGSCHCTVEIKTTLQSNYIPIKSKIKKILKNQSL